MPYTISHAIVAAPIAFVSRGRIPTSALVVGCMAPDFPYLLNLSPTHAPGHTALGLATHSLPSGLFVLALWRLWVAHPLLALFGLWREAAARPVAWTWWVLAAIGIVLGSASHALLDAASHESGWFVQRYLWLSADLLGLHVFKWVQHGGGVVGLLGLLAWYLVALHGQRSRQSQARSVPLGASIMVLSGVVFVVLANVVHDSVGTRAYAVNSATGIMSGVAVGAVVYATVMRLRWRQVSAA